jgi:prevent-host-death family protein
MVWKVAEAKQRFSEVLRRAERAPQVIQNRDRVVGAVIGAEDARAFQDFRARRRGPIGDALREAARICEEEREDLQIVPRADRPNPMLEAPRARRHQRHQ